MNAFVWLFFSGAILGAVLGFMLCAILSRSVPDPCNRPHCDRRIP
jgi:hypothetical protein